MFHASVLRGKTQEFSELSAQHHVLSHLISSLVLEFLIVYLMMYQCIDLMVTVTDVSSGYMLLPCLALGIKGLKQGLVGSESVY